MGYTTTLFIFHQLSDTITLKNRGFHIEKGNHYRHHRTRWSIFSRVSPRKRGILYMEHLGEPHPKLLESRGVGG